MFISSVCPSFCLSSLCYSLSGLCTRFFSSLKTVTVDGLASDKHSGEVLAVDYSVEAFGEEHMPYFYFTIACMLFFVIGIPLSIYLALRRNRQYLFIDEETASVELIQRHSAVVEEFGTLYLQYEKQYWWWEVTVVIKKMILTGEFFYLFS